VKKEIKEALEAERENWNYENQNKRGSSQNISRMGSSPKINDYRSRHLQTQSS